MKDELRDLIEMEVANYVELRLVLGVAPLSEVLLEERHGALPRQVCRSLVVAGRGVVVKNRAGCRGS